MSARGRGGRGAGRSRTGERSGGSGVGGRAFVRPAGRGGRTPGPPLFAAWNTRQTGKLWRPAGKPRRAPHAPPRRSPLPCPLPVRPSPPGARCTPRPPSSSPSPPSSSCPSPSPPFSLLQELRSRTLSGPSVAPPNPCPRIRPGRPEPPAPLSWSRGAQFSRACSAPQALGGPAGGWSPGLRDQESDLVPAARPSLPPATARASQTPRARAQTPPAPAAEPLSWQRGFAGASLGLPWGSGPCGQTPLPRLSPPASAARVLQLPFGTPENSFHVPWLSRACRHRRGARSSCETVSEPLGTCVGGQRTYFSNKARGQTPHPVVAPCGCLPQGLRRPRSARGVVPRGPRGFLSSDRAAFRWSEAFRLRVI